MGSQPANPSSTKNRFGSSQAGEETNAPFWSSFVRTILKPNRGATRDAQPTSKKRDGGVAPDVETFGCDDLNYVVHTLLRLNSTNPLVLALQQNGIYSLEDALRLSPAEVDGLEYEDERNPGTSLSLPKGTKKIFEVLRNASSYFSKSYGSWMEITPDDFDAFRVNMGSPSRQPRDPRPPRTPYHNSGTPQTPRSSSSSSMTLAQSFQKGVKRNVDDYPEFKSDKEWEQWSREVTTVTHNHDTFNVLDRDYKPSSHEEYDYFEKQKTYMFFVFQKKVKVMWGQHLLRIHHSTLDAQLFFRQLTDYYETSNMASLAQTDLLRAISTSILNPMTWRGEYARFYTLYMKRLHEYDRLTPLGDRLPDTMKMTMLQNAVATVPELHSIKTDNDKEIAHGRPPISWQNYQALLFQTCAALDHGAALSSRGKGKSHFSINAHEQVLEEDETELQEEDQESQYERESCDDLDEEEVTTLLEANFNNGKPRRPSMKREHWNSLSKEDKDIWDAMTDDGKARLLGYKGINTDGNSKLETNNYEILMSETHETQDPNMDEGDDSSLDKYIVSLAETSTQGEPNYQRYAYVHERCTYRISAHKTSKKGSLVDRGANGGIAGTDSRIISVGTRRVDISGINNHQLDNLKVVTAGAVAKSQRGEVIIILHQYAQIPNHDRTIHSSGQLEHFKNHVDDRSCKVGGKQMITTNDGYIFPLDIKSGLAYLKMRPYTDDEFRDLPHVHFTSDVDWDPNILDHEISNNDKWYDQQDDVDEIPDKSDFDIVGDYKKLNESEMAFSVDNHFLQRAKELIPEELDMDLIVNEHEMHKSSPDYKSFARFFPGLSEEAIKKTFDATTRYARRGLQPGMNLQKFYRSPCPALNVARRPEPVCTDTIYCDYPSVPLGFKAAQVYIGRNTNVSSVHGVKTDKAFVATLQEEIRRRGAMQMIVSDNARAETSKRVKDILRAYAIDDWQSEAYFQHQNYAERHYRDLKRNTNNLLNRTGAPPTAWLLAMQWISFLMNRIAIESLEWRTPMEKLTGVTPDISIILRFSFWEPVYFAIEEPSFPSTSTESKGRFVGASEHVGHSMTYKILDDKTGLIFHRSQVRSAWDTENINKKADEAPPKKPKKTLDEDPKDIDPIEDYIEYVKSSREEELKSDPRTTLPTIDIESIIGQTYLTAPKDDGTRYRAEVIEAIEENSRKIAANPETRRFRCSVDKGRWEEILTYNEIMNFLEKELEPGQYGFRDIVDHHGPVLKKNKKLGDKMKRWNGSSWNLKILWDDGTYTWEPRDSIEADDNVTVALYAQKAGLLETPGWKKYAEICKREKKLLRLINQTKLKAYRTTPVYKYGFEVPRDHTHAMELDKKNGNKKWQEAEAMELSQLDEYDTFINIGEKASTPEGYRKITGHFVYDIKHDGRHKARYVAGGHLTPVPVESVYSSVVSLLGIRIVTFLAELNRLKLWSTDIGNAYLEAKTKEKVYIIGGPEFGERHGSTLLISRALYGMRSSGARWHDRFYDVLVSEGFILSKAETDIWMRDKGDHYEYIAVYVDDLIIASKDPEDITNMLQRKHDFKLKGTGEVTFHLGCDYTRDEDGTLCVAPKSYIKRMIDTYEQMFGVPPKKNVTSPLEKGDHPENDLSEELDMEGVKKYQSMVGAMQWAVSLGRLDITTAVMTMSGFRAAPRKGHLERVKRIYAYLSQFRDGAIRVRTELPDFSDVPDQQYDWTHSTYGDVKEAVPTDAPEPKGKPVIHSKYVDANLFHDMITGRAVTGCIDMLNQTTVEWFSKKQPTVEAATYGSEFVAARTATDQTIAMRTILRYLGVNLVGKTYLFGDNESVVKSCTVPHSALKKRHNALAYHRVREAIAAKILAFIHIPGVLNPADILSKHWGHCQVWPVLRPLLFWHGDTNDLPPVQVTQKGSEKVSGDMGMKRDAHVPTVPSSQDGTPTENDSQDPPSLAASRNEDERTGAEKDPNGTDPTEST